MYVLVSGLLIDREPKSCCIEYIYIYILSLEDPALSQAVAWLNVQLNFMPIAHAMRMLVRWRRLSITSPHDVESTYLQS